MSAVLKAALRRGDIALAAMVEIDHPEGFARFWSGVGNIEHDGETFIGCGRLGRIEAVSESTEIEIAETRFVLSGVDAALVAGLDKSVKGRKGRIYEAVLDSAWRVIHRELLSETALDSQIYTIDKDGSATIAIVAHAGLFFLRNRSAAKWSPEEARRAFPGETGFDEIHKVEDQTLNWAAA